jgi:hypothetical protein
MSYSVRDFEDHLMALTSMLAALIGGALYFSVETTASEFVDYWL